MARMPGGHEHARGRARRAGWNLPGVIHRMSDQNASMTSLRGKRVFVVEDDDRLYCALKDALQGAGCETFGSSSAISKSLDAVPESYFDLALVDVSREDSHVAALVQRFRQRKVPLLLITAERSQQPSSPAHSRGRLNRPFTEQELLEGVLEVIGYSAALRGSQSAAGVHSSG
jgi:DNA-binding response OmpR family regulator